MAKTRVIAGLVAGCLILGSVVPAWADPKVEQILLFAPKQKDVVYSTPAKEEQATCEVNLVSGRVPGSSGWLLKDAKKQPLRRFFDSNGDKKIDIYSYYKDGVEVYREIDTNFNDKPDQYRWLGSGGMKWGMDKNEDGKIDYWMMISAEEVAQEIFQAVVTQNFERLRALFISEQELRALKVPPAQIERMRGNLQNQVARKWSEVLKIPGIESAQFERVESAVPHCHPAEGTGSEDVIKFPSRAILYQMADKKHEWIHSGEMIQVGLAWRLVDGPSTQEGSTDPTVDPPSAGIPRSKVLDTLLEELSKLDNAPPMPGPNADKAGIIAYNQKRVDLIQKIVPLDAQDQKESWTKQIFDNLQAWAIAEYPQTTALKLLTQKKNEILEKMPGLAAHATFRELWATYSPLLEGRSDAKGTTLAKIQEEWMDKLAKFVQAYPKADDTPEALNHLGMGCEFAGQDEQAKRWYQQLVTNFPEHQMTEKAKGSVRRLSLIGQEMELVGPTLEGPSFNLSNLKGKVVAVYYWASYCEVCVGDFARIKKLQETHGAKGFELVCINLDDRPEIAQGYLQKTLVQGQHLFQAPPKDAGGLASPLATQYGINGLPTLFLVGRDGKVINRTLQVGDLEDALKKAL